MLIVLQPTCKLKVPRCASDTNCTCDGLGAGSVPCLKPYCKCVSAESTADLQAIDMLMA